MPETGEGRRMFVGGLFEADQEDDLKQLFTEKCGGCGDDVVQDVLILKKSADPANPKKRLIGFVTFTHGDYLEEVLLQRPIKFEGRQLEVKHAMPKGNTHPGIETRTNKLFVMNLPKENPGQVEDALKKEITDQYNEKYGTVEKVELVRNKEKEGECKGFGFITVSSEDFADRLAINEKQFIFQNRTIEIKKSEPKGERGGKQQSGWGNYTQQSGGGYGGGYDTYGGQSSYSQGGYGGAYGYGGWGYGGGYEQTGYGSRGTSRGGSRGGQGTRGRGRGRGGRY